MKKILITLLLMAGFSCLSVNAQPSLKKPPRPNKPVKPKPERTQNKPAKPQKAQAQSSAPRVVATGTINGHEYVDLGLSVKWATCNVGANSPSDYGDYFAWGETSTKSEYTEANCVTYNKSMSDFAGDSRYDAARANWGGTWRLPTKVEIDELVNKCKHEWIKYDGHRGYLITGTNGNSIFIPAAGFRLESSFGEVGKEGCYWSSTPYNGNVIGAVNFLYFSGHGGFGGSWMLYHHGQSVRPVTE